ncbi:MAG: choice-of-anchor Q domain-containing protein, partial [Planctomycetota bacterium]
WVDIAAPGVDILSLRAKGTSMGSTYDDFTTIASGTSMSCPHVSGACALMLSLNNGLGPDDLLEILTMTVDPIDPGICSSNGRLNIYEALKVVNGRGSIKLDDEYYSCSDVITIRLFDLDLKGQTNYTVEIIAGNDTESVILVEQSGNGGRFTGTIQTSGGPKSSYDSILQVVHEEIITVNYLDSDDGAGNIASVNDIAIADCLSPAISEIDIDDTVSIPLITFETDEPAIGRVYYNSICGEPCGVELIESELATNHSFKIKGLLPDTSYFYFIEVTDYVGHTTTDDENGNCYGFTTISDEIDINVPSDYNTIQDAIDHSWNSNTIWIEDGTYRGQGNYNINYDGRLITVKSQNGPENCVIDCEWKGRGFTFENGEDSTASVEGLTITNGYAPSTSKIAIFEAFAGGAVFCLNSNPTIKNCHIINNRALDWGGGLYIQNEPEQVSHLVGCVIENNRTSIGKGGGILNLGNVELEDCFIRSNTTPTSGGGIFNIGNTILRGCEIVENTAQKGSGGGVVCIDGIFNLNSTTISDNRAPFNTGGGLFSERGDLVMNNSIISRNSAFRGGGTSLNNGTFNLTNCTVVGNEGTQRGGGLYSPINAEITLDNCIFWANDANDINSITVYVVTSPNIPASLSISYCDIDNNSPGITISEDVNLNWGNGNISQNPDFAFEKDYHLLSNSPCIDSGTNTPNIALDVVDADGNARLLDGNGDSFIVVDMGAYEYNTSNPTIALSDSKFEFYCTEDGNDPNSQNLSIKNCGGGTLNWEIDENCSWLDLDVYSGSSMGEVNTVDLSVNGEVNTVDLSVNNSGLISGTYNCKLIISDSSAINRPRTIYVRLHVGGILRVPAEYHTIQDAVDEAQEGDVVLIADGIYSSFGNRDIHITKGITLQSENGFENCIIDCQGSLEDPHRGIHIQVEDEPVKIKGLSIINGFINGEWLAPLTVSFAGGGILCHAENVYISNCLIEDCVTAGPLWPYGGGIWLEDDSRYFLGEASVENCVILNNSAEGYGGGIAHMGTNAKILNTVLSYNVSESKGGGIYCRIPEDPNLNMFNCTIINNSAKFKGGGLSIEFYDVNSLGIDLKNSIVRGNTVGDFLSAGPQISVENDVVENDVGLAVSFSNIENGEVDIYFSGGTVIEWRQGNIDADPMFVNSDVNDFHLLPDSPCKDTGDWSDDYSQKVDNDGENRAMGECTGRVDMGADEVYYPAVWNSLTHCYGDTDFDGGVYTMDWSVFRDAFGSWYGQVNYNPGADFDRDGDVDTSDWPVFRDNYGKEVLEDCSCGGIWPPIQ